MSARIFAICLLVFGSLCPCLAQAPPPAPPRVVHGIVTTESGKPLARATLYLFGLPYGLTDGAVTEDANTVVTDARGRFLWTVPETSVAPEILQTYPSINCYVLSADRQTERLRVAFPPGTEEQRRKSGISEAVQRATRLTQAHWVTGGKEPLLSVIAPDVARVVLTMRGPDGKPLRLHDMEAAPVETFPYQGTEVYRSRTDAAGHLSLRCFPGPQQFQVFAAGVGSGSTGVFSAAANQMATPVLPPLAPFARLSGTVAPALMQPGATVSLSNYSNTSDWCQTPAYVTAAGQWTLKDVLPGQYFVALTGGRGEKEQVMVTVLPGQKLSGIRLVPKKPPTETVLLAQSLLDRAPLYPASPDSVVEGRVTTSDGKPVAGADVYAIYWVTGGMSGAQTVHAAKTDVQGMYHFSGWPVKYGKLDPAVTLVAHLSGLGIATAEAALADGPNSLRPIRQDLVLPASSASLTVRVLQNGVPAANIPVSIGSPGKNPVIPTMYRESDRGDAANALRTLLTPSASTGPDGTATFKDLTPGLWTVTANRTILNLLADGPPPPSNISNNVAVQAGESRSFTLSLLPKPGPIDFYILLPNSTLPSTLPDTLNLSTAHYSSYGSVRLTQKGMDIVSAGLSDSGVFQATVRFGETPLDPNTPTGPYDTGSVLVAASPATAARTPVLIQTQRVGPASLRVRLRDAAGKPARGTVTVGKRVGEAQYTASVGSNGVVVFSAMPEGKYVVAAHFAGRPERAALGEPGTPLPSDAALRAGTGQPLPVPVTLNPGEQASVTLGAAPLGYVRLHLNGTPTQLKNVYVEAQMPGDEDFFAAQFDPATRDYVMGPLPPGRRTFNVYRYVPAPVSANVDTGQTTLTVKSGQVVSGEVTLHSTAAQEDLDAAPLTAIVLLPDGKTPAWGARAGLFVPQHFQPRRMAGVDTLGRPTLKDFWQGEWNPLPSPPSVLTEPVLAAWLPGANGAVVVPFHPGREERLVLPPACAMTGRVTVGGQGVTALPSQFRVRAAYQNRGELNEALSVEGAAQADGTFTLAGLTPGIYLVQAARDNIWVSQTQTLTVGAEAPAPMALDIAPLGVPMVLHLRDTRGKALAGQTVHLNLPTGPLTDALWPQTLTTDSRGDLRVEGLTAGPQSVTVGKETLAFTVPPFATSLLPVRRELVLGKRAAQSK